MLVAFAALLLQFQACSGRKAASPQVVQATPTRTLNASRFVGADGERDNWLIYGRTYNENRFSPLTQINRDSVARLKLAWYADLGADARGQESTPLVADGVMYATSSWSIVLALDAATGTVRWQYDPKVPREWGVNACCDVVNRGVALWEDMVYVGTLDGRLVALSARDGHFLWETTIIDRSERASITGAPRIINGKVFIGSGGGEFGARGRLISVDARTGAILWRTFTVPGNPANRPENLHLPKAAKTWTGDWWQFGGGGMAWDAMAYDPALDILYVGTGNGSPWPQSIRSPKGGDNLYVSSILAMRGETGELLWYYQTTPGDEWGYDAASQLILADLRVGGQMRLVVMQASSNGFFYVLDRTNGQLLSATPFVPTTWARSVDLRTGRPVEDPKARYSRTGRSFAAQPGPRGAHSWQPMTFNPTTSLVYIPAQLNAAQLSVSKEPLASRYRLATGVTITHPKDLTPDTSELIAWDPIQERARWVIERDTPVASGVLSTAGGLVFQGTSTGSLEAFDAETGKRLGQTNAGSPVLAAPISYAVSGTQYIAVVAGAGGASMLDGGTAMANQSTAGSRARILVYSLQGKSVLPQQHSAPTAANLDMRSPPDSKLVAKGEGIYAANCARCHGRETVNAGPLTPLTSSAALIDAKQWNLIAFAGLLGAKGMPGFMGDLKPDDVEAVRTYVLQQAFRLKSGANSPTEIPRATVLPR